VQFLNFINNASLDRFFFSGGCDPLLNVFEIPILKKNVLKYRLILTNLILYRWSADYYTYRPSPYRAVNTFHLGYKNQSVAQVAVCSQINTKHINTVWAERTVVECKLVVQHVTSRLYLKTQSVPRCKHFSSRL